jgi:hypothetical protein
VEAGKTVKHFRTFAGAGHSRHRARRCFNRIRHLPIHRQHSVAYMAAFNGWVHDRFGKIWMLDAEAILALAGIAGGLIALQQINARRVPLYRFVLD